MSKCENCIHYEVCNGALLYPKAELNCKQFKDKSLFVELPCKVGDELWVNWERYRGKRETHPVKVYALRFDTKKNNMRICVEGKFEINAYGGSYTHYYNGTFAWNKIGKTLFLTKEEAEKKLQEMG